jgi:phosphotransferase system enzyme I (PtsI)
MAGELELTPLLIGLGLDELSASTGQIPFIKQAVRKLALCDCQSLADLALSNADAVTIHEMSRAIARRAYPDLID